MPGKKINQIQIGLYMKFRKEGKSQISAAAKAGFSERSARNLKKRQHQEASTTRNWKTRKDPFEDVWESKIVSRLDLYPNLQAKTLLEELQLEYPEQFPDNLLRTLQRRVRQWKATHGPAKEIIFRQDHPPGFQGLSDFTPANNLHVSINGELLDHNLYHYRLAFSGWEHAEVVLGGESFSALAEGLQNALWLCGGVPETHRTDSLSAAFKNLSLKEKEDFTKGYEELVAHYGIEATRNNKGVSHENGAIEASHRHLKSRIDQALMIRGSRDFSSIDEYRQFIREILMRRNQRIRKAYMEELAYLKDLPERKTTDFTEERVKVTNSSTIQVKSIVYSVPSRLIGMTLKVHLYDDRLELFVGGEWVLNLKRQRRNKKRVYQIDYRHLIDQLIKKPGAFKNYIYKEAMFPTLAFRLTWEKLLETYDNRKACREYLGILKEAAHRDREDCVSHYLEKELARGVVPTRSEVRSLFYKESETLPEIESCCVNLEDYDHLIGGRA
jgi:hypothetical protein